MFQHVAYGMSFGTLEEMLREFFDLGVHKPELHVFKSLFARYYKPTYRRLLKKILSGPVMHTDDTEVKTTNRQGLRVRDCQHGRGRLHVPADKRRWPGAGLLKASTAFSFPTSIRPMILFRVRMQKCLIHLMRDINQDLLNNPFDQELQSITGPFGTLLRSVVETVDHYGLKRRYLKKA